MGRTFGCVRLVWNKTLAERHHAYHTEGKKTSYTETDAALSEWKRTGDLAFLSEVSSVPLQQTLRHQHTAYQNFFAGRAKYPRFKNRNSRQSADFAVTSDGERIANLEHLDPKARNLARYQRQMARSARGTVDKPGRNVRAKAGLNRAIRDAALGEFRRQVEYKAERAGKRVVVIDRWYPSSKTCSHCGCLLDKLKLSTRHWSCPGCRTRHDRDINAAKNILAAGQAVAGENPGEACGAGVSRQGSSLPQSATKQELPGASPMGIPALWGGEEVKFPSSCTSVAVANTSAFFRRRISEPGEEGGVGP